METFEVKISRRGAEDAERQEENIFSLRSLRLCLKTPVSFVGLAFQWVTPLTAKQLCSCARDPLRRVLAAMWRK